MHLSEPTYWEGVTGPAVFAAFCPPALPDHNSRTAASKPRHWYRFSAFKWKCPELPLQCLRQPSVLTIADALFCGCDIYHEAKNEWSYQTFSDVMADTMSPS